MQFDPAITSRSRIGSAGFDRPFRPRAQPTHAVYDIAAPEIHAYILNYLLHPGRQIYSDAAQPSNQISHCVNSYFCVVV